jgi:hypothetical protein
VALAPPKTPASYRRVPLAATVADVLAAHLSQWPAHDDPGLIFMNEREQRRRRSTSTATFSPTRRTGPVPLSTSSSVREVHQMCTSRVL